MKQNKNIPRKLSLEEANRIGSQSRKADVEEARALRAQFSTPESQPILTAGDEFEQRILRGPTDADMKQMLRDEDAERWHQREMSPDELAEQAKWDAFAQDTATKATRRAIPGARAHRIDVHSKRSKAQNVHVMVIPSTPGMGATDNSLEANAHFHHQHNSGEVDKAS
jgi:hypothetical protein